METEEEKAEREAIENSNSNPSIDNNIDTTKVEQERTNLFMAALREREQENVRLKNQLELAQNQNRSNNNQNPDEQWKQFTDNPDERMEAAVRRTVAPINEFIQTYQKNETINKFKQIFRNNPQFKPVFDYAEHHIDTFLANVPEVNMNTMQLALLTVTGAIATGQIQVPGLNLNLNNSNSNDTNPRSNITPPVTPRSVTPLPNNQDNKNNITRELTETERKFMRMSGLTEEEYKNGLSDSPLQVKNILTPNK